MDPLIGDFEVVHVTRPCALLDADFRERVYRRRDGVPLRGGYYVVGWPAGAQQRRFDERAVFRGPFGTRGDAIGAMREMQGRGRPSPGADRGRSEASS